MSLAGTTNLWREIHRKVVDGGGYRPYRSIMRIGPFEVGPGHPTFVIAELSCSHGGSYEDAERLVEAAAQAGANAVKTQFYAPASLTCNSDHPAYVLPSGPWKGQRLWDLYATSATPHDWHAPLFAKARELGMAGFGTAYDIDGVWALRKAGTDALKVASFEVTDRVFLAAVAEQCLPTLASTGLASRSDLRFIASECAQNGFPDLGLMHCVSAYPATLWNLSRIRKLRKYANVVGFSDHTGDVTAGAYAVAAGANILEVHVQLPGVASEDAGFALMPDRLATYVQNVRHMEMMMADVPDPGVAHQTPLLRRLVWAETLSKGQKVTAGHLRTARCGEGLAPALAANLVGRTLAEDVKAGDPTTLEQFG